MIICSCVIRLLNQPYSTGRDGTFVRSGSVISAGSYGTRESMSSFIVQT